jgi:methionyl-tRNA formyltransferase
MKVVALCASVRTALRLWRGLRSVAGVDLRFLVFGTSPSNEARVTGLKNLAPAAGLALAGRLHVTRHGLDHPRTLEWLQQLQPDVGLHACGSIYRKPLIACFRRGILNAHIGLLPAFRGRSVMEWSILQGRPTGVTVFFLDEGIDTGREIVLRREVPLRGHRGVGAAKDFLFSLDAPMFAEALELLQRPDFALLQNDGSGRRFYVMSRLFTGVVDAVLRSAEPT